VLCVAGGDAVQTELIESLRAFVGDCVPPQSYTGYPDFNADLTDDYSTPYKLRNATVITQWPFLSRVPCAFFCVCTKNWLRFGRAHRNRAAATQGRAGITNQGMTCYMNAALQQLFHIPAACNAVMGSIAGTTSAACPTSRRRAWLRSSQRAPCVRAKIDYPRACAPAVQPQACDAR
jgi:hypothetical protein